MYYPKSKVQESLFTNGAEFVLVSSGKAYKGYYHTTYDGNIYTGATHTTDSQQLKPSSQVSNVTTNTAGSQVITPSLITNFEYDQITKNRFSFLKQESIPSPYYPILTTQDYIVGQFVRYFMKRVGGTERDIKEISKDGFGQISGNLLYTSTQLNWKLTGPIHDNVVSPVMTVYGVVDTNERTLSGQEKTFPGISRYLSNLIELARII